ncbi:MAG: hypothetical protein L6R37_008193 [Teloschistes peruensis]|nr:MAG: hypothetical protein L6R37_008193 [Teloschistes peruensis]
MEVLKKFIGTLPLPTAVTTSAFPFHKLPQELRLQILHYALPQNGLTHPSSRTEDFHWDIAGGDRVKIDGSMDSALQSLLLTDKWTYTNSWDLLRRSTAQYITLDTIRIRFLNQNLFIGNRYPSHLTFTRMPFFRYIQHYHLDMSPDCPPLNTLDLDATQKRWFLKETVRTLADALSTNEDIKSLTVTIPCRCWIKINQSVLYHSRRNGRELANMWTCLSPLKRLQVRDPMKITAYSVIDGRGTGVSCTHPKCQLLVQKATTEFGHLRGEPLSEGEETWKRLETLPRPHISIILTYARETANQTLLIARIYLDNKDKVAFEEEAQKYEEDSEQFKDDRQPTLQDLFILVGAAAVIIFRGKFILDEGCVALSSVVKALSRLVDQHVCKGSN